MATLPLPPSGTPYLDPSTGIVSEVWRRYFLSLEDALAPVFPPADAQYWVSTSNAELTNARNLGGLSSGYLTVATTLGIGVPGSVATIPAGDLTPGGTLPGLDGSNLTALEAAWPIGSIYENGIVSTNPAILFGFGTWAIYGPGRVSVGLDPSDPDFDTPGETGGAKTVAAAGTIGAVSAGTPAGTVSAPIFTGNAVAAASTVATPDLVAPDTTGTGVSPVTTATGTNSVPTFTGSALGTHTHTFTGSATSVVQPSIVSYKWMRTA